MFAPRLLTRALTHVCAAVLVVACISFARHACATGITNEEILFVTALVEVPVPDLRVEATDPARVVLSWPLHVEAGRFLGRHPRSDDVLLVSTFVEPQWRPSGADFRLLGGARGTIRVPGFVGPRLLVEGAALYGTDGSGGGFGAGLELLESFSRGYSRMGVGAVVWRHLFTRQGQRDDLSVDIVHIAF